MSRRQEKAIEAQRRMDAVEYADETGFAAETEAEASGSEVVGQLELVTDGSDKHDSASRAGASSSSSKADAVAKPKPVLEARIVSQQIIRTKAAGPLMVTTAGQADGGTTLLFLPNLGTPCRVAFGAFLRSLRGHLVLKDARILMVDLPGQHAGADLWKEAEDGPYPTIGRMAEGVLEAITQIGTKHVLLCVGLGLGANISLRIIGMRQYFIHGQVLVGATADRASN